MRRVENLCRDDLEDALKGQSLRSAMPLEVS